MGATNPDTGESAVQYQSLRQALRTFQAHSSGQIRLSTSRSDAAGRESAQLSGAAPSLTAGELHECAPTVFSAAAVSHFIAARGKRRCPARRGFRGVCSSSQFIISGQHFLVGLKGHLPGMLKWSQEC